VTAYLIRYLSPDKGECLDLQHGFTLLDAACAHFRAFPRSISPRFRRIG
jgi:hypothetical protein